MIPTLTSYIIYTVLVYGCDIWALNNIQTFCIYHDYSHNIIDNHVPLASLTLHMCMDNDLLYDMGLHLGASLPSTISVA